MKQPGHSSHVCPEVGKLYPIQLVEAPLLGFDEVPVHLGCARSACGQRTVSTRTARVRHACAASARYNKLRVWQTPQTPRRQQGWSKHHRQTGKRPSGKTARRPSMRACALSHPTCSHMHFFWDARLAAFRVEKKGKSRKRRFELHRVCSNTVNEEDYFGLRVESPTLTTSCTSLLDIVSPIVLSPFASSSHLGRNSGRVPKSCTRATLHEWC